MCIHNQPTRNKLGEGAPEVTSRDIILFDEPGRCQPMINGKGETDYHSHYFRLVKTEMGPYRLLVRHGAGQEELDLSYGYTRIQEILAVMDSDVRYLMLHALYCAGQTGSKAAREETREHYRKAFVTGRLKKRKNTKYQDGFKVWIEPEIIRQEMAA